MFIGTVNQKPNPESFHLKQKRVSNLQRYKQSKRAVSSQVQPRKVSNTSERVVVTRDEQPSNHVERVAQVVHKQSTRVKKQRMRENRLSVHSSPDLFDQNRRNTSSRKNSHHFQASPPPQIGVMPSQVKLSSSPPPVQSASNIKVDAPLGYKIGSSQGPSQVSSSQISTSENPKSFVTNQQGSTTLGMNLTVDSNSNMSSIKELLATKRIKKSMSMASDMQELQNKWTDQVIKTVNELLDAKLKTQKEDIEKTFDSNVQLKQQIYENNIISHLGLFKSNIQFQIDSQQKDVSNRLASVDEVVTKEVARKMGEIYVDLEHKVNEKIEKSMTDLHNTINNNLELLNQRKSELTQSIESLHHEIDTQKKSFREQVMSEFDQEIQKQKTELESNLKVTLRTDFDERVNLERDLFMEEVKNMIESKLPQQNTTTPLAQQEPLATSVEQDAAPSKQDKPAIIQENQHDVYIDQIPASQGDVILKEYVINDQDIEYQ
jgi:hypothetical protein